MFFIFTNGETLNASELFLKLFFSLQDHSSDKGGKECSGG